jgi:hypothetical protein
MGKSIFQKFQKKRYAPDRYKNPYFRRKDKKAWWPIILIVACILLFVAGGVYLLRADRFNIDAIQVQGTETIDPQNITSLTNEHLDKSKWWFFSSRNTILFSEKSLRDALNEKYAFEKLNIQREDRALSIQVEEKTSELLWYTENTPYLVDLEGNVIRRLTDAEIGLLTPGDSPDGEERESSNKAKRLRSLPVFRDINNNFVDPGMSVLTREEVENIFTFQKHLNAQEIGFSEVQVDRLAGKWMSVVTDTGYRILFDPLGDIDQQAINLQTILRESVENPQELKYIDLRFGDHVYVK